ncbi:hypothetical protein [Actinomadura decatromicini]|uniref:hypothetical protein n=1 Tax=Actinomadura decatromicini TaxID=2604572 RepID=UPI001CA343C9|nr:hypothetical protein [Actinomadura decatromicini]
MLLTTSVKVGLSTAVVASALLIPTGASASAASHTSGKTVSAATSFDAKCRSHSRNYILKRYYRGPQTFTLRCGTRTWGWKHIKARHGWNRTMDRKIGTAIWSGDPNGRGGYSTYTNQCPRREKFRTIIGTPAGSNDLLTAYPVNQLATTGSAC